jgi:hypothetical protein
VTNIHFPLVHTPMSAASGIYEGTPGLSAEGACGMIVEAIRTRPARISVRLGIAFQIAWLIAPAAMQRLLGSRYGRSLARDDELATRDGSAGANGAYEGDIARAPLHAAAREASIS